MTTKPEDLWNEGKTTFPTILPAGKYEVTAISGVLLLFNVLKDHKIIYEDGGHNIARGKLWGWFHKSNVSRFPTDPQIQDDYLNDTCHINDLCLNYKHDSNPESMRSIRDYLRLTKDGSAYIGRLVRGGQHLGFFTLAPVSTK